MESLKAYAALAWKRLRELCAWIQSAKHPYCIGFAVLCCYGLILVANSVVRNRELHDALSVGYVVLLYIGGTIGLVANSLVRTLGFYALFRHRIQGSFGALFLGIVVFGCVTAIAALLNLVLPILVTIRTDGIYSSFSILSLQFFLEGEVLPVFLQALVELLDVLVVTQLAAHTIYISWVTRSRFWIVFLAASLLEVSIRVIGKWLLL